LWWWFDEGGLAAGVEKQISPLHCAPVEMTILFVGLRAWFKDVDESGLRAKAREKKQEQKQILRLRRRMTTKKQKVDAKAMQIAKAKAKQKQKQKQKRTKTIRGLPHSTSLRSECQGVGD
jgi:hypothetical protein